MAKPRTRKANTSIKHRSKQYRHANKDEPNPLIWARFTDEDQDHRVEIGFGSIGQNTRKKDKATKGLQ